MLKPRLKTWPLRPQFNMITNFFLNSYNICFRLLFFLLNFSKNFKKRRFPRDSKKKVNSKNLKNKYTPYFNKTKLFVIFLISLFLIFSFVFFYLFSKQKDVLAWGDRLSLFNKATFYEVRCGVINNSFVGILVIEITSDGLYNDFYYIFNAFSKTFNLKLDKSVVKKYLKIEDFKSFLVMNLYYVDNKTFLRRMRNMFWENLYLKVDIMVLTKDISIFKTFIEYESYDLIRKFLYYESLQTKVGEVYFDVCQDDLKKYILYFKPKLDKFREIKEHDFLDQIVRLDEIKKEQLRIHIVDQTGAEVWGSFVKRLLENYSIIVSKVDVSSRIIEKTEIRVSDSENLNSSTVSLLKYLLSIEQNLEKNDDITLIFSEIKVFLGRDLLIQFFE